MKWLGALLAIIQSLLDRLPSRRESILNQILETKSAIKRMQEKQGWTATDTANYYVLVNKLSDLEKRRDNNS